MGVGTVLAPFLLGLGILFGLSGDSEQPRTAAAQSGSAAAGAAGPPEDCRERPCLKAGPDTESQNEVKDVLDQLARGNTRRVRVVSTEEELNELYAQLTKGEGAPGNWYNYDGTVFARGDGIQVGLRNTSSGGTPTIDIDIPGESNIKIHIG